MSGSRVLLISDRDGSILLPLGSRVRAPIYGQAGSGPKAWWCSPDSPYVWEAKEGMDTPGTLLVSSPPLASNYSWNRSFVIDYWQTRSRHIAGQR